MCYHATGQVYAADATFHRRGDGSEQETPVVLTATMCEIKSVDLI